jgi:hypothetical protein
VAVTGKAVKRSRVPLLGSLQDAPTRLTETVHLAARIRGQASQNEEKFKRAISRNQSRELHSSNDFGTTSWCRYTPIPGQGLSTKLYVQVPTGVTRYPAGTQFLIRAKLTQPKNGRPYLKSYHNWDYTVLRATADPDNQPHATILAECLPSALVGQIRQIEEGSVSGSS